MIEIAERARVAGVPLLVSLSPSIAQVQPAIWDRVVRSGESGEAELDRDLPQRRLEALGREHGFRVRDLTPALRAARERGEATYYMVEKHRTAAGNRVVAAALYEAIAADASLRTAAGIQESGREGPRGALDASAALP